MKDTVALAQDLLASRFGGLPEFTQVDDLGGRMPGRVLRARVAQNPFLPQRSVVIKRTDNTSAFPNDSRTVSEANFLQEIASYQFTNTLSEQQRPGPVLLAHDVENQLLVLTDLGDGTTLADTLSSPPSVSSTEGTKTDDHRAESGYRKLAHALGRMHLSTAHAEQDYDALHARLAQGTELDHSNDSHAETVAYLEKLISSLTQRGVITDESQEKLLNRVLGLYDEGFYRAFSPFDLSPENILISDSGHFLDFEWAGFRDATIDLCCILAGFPHDTVGEHLNAEQVSDFLDIWSREVEPIWPDIRSSRQFTERMGLALLGWYMLSMAEDFTEAGRENIRETLTIYGELAHVENANTEFLELLEQTVATLQDSISD